MWKRHLTLISLLGMAFTGQAAEPTEAAQDIATKIEQMVKQAAAADQAHIDQMRKRLEERMGIRVNSITPSPYGGMYEVIANDINVFYTDHDATVAFIGKLYDLKTQKDLIEARTHELLTLDFASLPLKDAIVTVNGKGGRKIAVFSDPECPFCQELERELAKVENLTIYTFLLPIKEIHPDAERKAKLVMCAGDRAKAWGDLMLRKQEPTGGKTDCDTPLAAIREFARQHRINGTPAIIFADGKLEPGQLLHGQIERQLEASEVNLAKAAPKAN